MKINEAFEKWRLQYISTHTGYFKMSGTDDLAQVVWQSAIEHKQKEIEDKLKTEKERSLKLVEAISNWVEWENEQIKKDGEYISVRLNGLIANAKKVLAEYKKED